ncbi:MAG: L-fucose/L-arabinose isomerase family protein [Anaerolineales bacterium]|nr:L-fucose/L-arabinose isomerase family protein [Anaerolineales bacterium]
MHYTIAFVPLARTTFDILLAEQVALAARQNLQAAGYQLIGPDHLITDLSMAQAVADELRSASFDLLIVFQATFADSTMVTSLAEATRGPILLWAVPEARTGGRLRLNSLCGINLAGHALTLRRRGYDYAYLPPDSPQILDKIAPLAGAGNVYRRLQKARLGVVGEHPAGMDSCHLDAAGLKEHLGLEVIQIDLAEVFTRARGLPDDAIQPVRMELDRELDNLESLEQAPLRGTLSVYAALDQIAKENELDGLAVRCWPEFFTELGCAACGAMSMLSEGFITGRPVPCSCEADINGTVTQLILQWLAEQPAFGTDLVVIDVDEDVIALWHCGLAPFSMADPNVQKRGTIHSNRRLPLLMEFPLKPGEVTFARLSQATGELRLVMGRGEMLSAPAPFSGTSGTLRMEISAQRFLDALMTEGLEHHISLAYGDYLPALQSLARLLNLPVLNLTRDALSATSYPVNSI